MKNKQIYDWRDYLVFVIIVIIFFFISIDFFKFKSSNTVIYHPKHKHPFDIYKPEWTKNK